MNQLYQVRQCTADACRLRFPVLAEQLPTMGCPRCGALTEICVETVVNNETPNGYSCSQEEAARIANRLPIVIVVDNVRSLFNVGSIFRSADGAGVAHLYLCGITPTPANPKLAKTALGAELTVPWRYFANSLDCIAQLQRAGYCLWALEETPAALSIFDAPLPVAPLALIVGNEVSGIDPALLAAADVTVALPMYGTKRSLNVATAFGAAVILLTHRTITNAPTATPPQQRPTATHLSPITHVCRETSRI